MTTTTATNLEYEVASDKNQMGTWRVEATDHEGDGDVYVACFSGPKAEECAREYAAFKASHR
jgi:hypothetical protein